MPDNDDYQWLSRALSAPEAWSEKERRTISFLLDQAKVSLAETPAHHRGDVARLKRSIADYETALRRHEESRRR